MKYIYSAVSYEISCVYNFFILFIYLAEGSTQDE